MKWAKTKAMESCNQQDAPELDLPPLRGINRLTNNLVSMAGYKEDQHEEIEDFQQFLRYYNILERRMRFDKMKMMLMMMKMKEMMDSKEDDYDVQGLNVRKATYVPTMFRRGDKMSDMSSMLRFFEKNKMKDEDESDNYSSMESMFRSMGKMRFKRQADDSLALNDRLKEKLEHMMNEHVEHVSNMTCVLREMKVIDQNNNIDVRAMKKDAEQYKLPSAWFGDRYEEILDSCYEVAENLPAGLQDKVLPNNYNGPMRNLGKIKSFMNCCKSAKMKLCMYQDTKKKIETNFGPVDQLLEGFNNQITEEQVFYMVNELLQGDDDEFM